MKAAKGIHFLLLAILAFMAIAVDGVLIIGVEPILYAAQWPEWTTLQYVMHYIAICFIWGVCSFLLIQLSSKKLDFLVMQKGSALKVWQWIAVAAAIIFMLGLNYSQWQGMKVVGEFQKKGLTIFLFQYLYYMFETDLFTLIIVFGQRACELWFKKRNFPYGGVVVALTWGLGHIFSKGSVLTGLFTALAGFLFGAVYLIVNRDFKKASLILFIMFSF